MTHMTVDGGEEGLARSGGGERCPYSCFGLCSLIFPIRVNIVRVGREALPQTLGLTLFIRSSLNFTADSPGSYLTGRQQLSD